MIIGVTDWVENILGKGENAGYRHFLLFPQCFQKASFPGSLCGKELSGQWHNNEILSPFTTQIPTVTTVKKKTSVNIVGKGVA